MPLYVGVEQVEDHREVTAGERGVPALECFDVRLAHGVCSTSRLIAC